MSRSRLAPALAAAATLLTGCGIDASGVLDGGDAPTGVAPGVTLYFVDDRGELRGQLTQSSRLGDVTNAVDLLLRIGDGSSDGLRSDLPRVESLGPTVTVAGTVLTVNVPLARRDVGPLGVDQLVCTALGVRTQSGDTGVTHAVVSFTHGGSTEPGTCPAP
ncbi:hypothetical protein [Prauserella cavernicola]|uniref:Lipoprotein n=1 Tax=Prauserella cavernicola TaxID=2800127 RepID=A0A934V1S8_9PSEU|nr:hypothetical protein [Prauserella cavernicola]MBK1783821.1 hypothetical protein [Prauserella cavernicola]